MRRRRLGPATMDVLQAIAAGHRYGFDIMEHADLPGGTVYPALATLERDGLVRASWENPRVARAEKRPPRRYYVIAHQGEMTLRRERDRLKSLDSLVDSAAPRRRAARNPEPRKA